MGLRLDIDGEPHAVEIVRRKPHLVVRIDGREHAAALTDDRVTVDGEVLDVVSARDGNTAFVHLDGRAWTIALIDPRDAVAGHDTAADEIRAPMPGAVVWLHKAEGENVTRGETVITIESMKLQTALAAPRDGVIAQVKKREGDTFDRDEVIATLQSEAAE